MAMVYPSTGTTPKGLHVAVCNLDQGPEASFLKLGDTFLQQLSNSSITQESVGSIEEGLSRVRSGSCWGLFALGANFTADTIKRYTTNASIDVIQGSTVAMYLDNSNQQISVELQQQASTAYQGMIEQFLTLIGEPTLLASLPINYLQPIYGQMSPSFTDFVAPG